jgi:hypothetical protein
MNVEPLEAPTAYGGASHRRWREGARAGLFGAGAGALWSLLVDVAAGHPFKTWYFLGYSFLNLVGLSESRAPALAAVVFLSFVALVFMVVGRVAVGIAHRADVQPGLILVTNLVLTLVTLALVAFATAFTTSRLGTEAWLQILGSTLIALWALVFRVYRTHPSLGPDFKRVPNA